MVSNSKIWVQTRLEPFRFTSHIDWTLVVACRTDTVNKSFPGSLLVDDFIHRLEIGLYSYGFTGDNSIGKGRNSDLCCDAVQLGQNAC